MVFLSEKCGQSDQAVVRERRAVLTCNARLGFRVFASFPRGFAFSMSVWKKSLRRTA